MTQPQPNVRDLHNNARKALELLRVEVRAKINEADMGPFNQITQKIEDTLDEADTFLQRIVSDIEDAAGRVM